MVARQICDFCGDAWPNHRVPLTRRPNDDYIEVELCGVCLRDFAVYIKQLLAKQKNTAN